MTKDLKSLDPKDRLIIIEKLMYYTIPKMSSTKLTVDELSDQHLDTLIIQITKNIEDENWNFPSRKVRVIEGATKWSVGNRPNTSTKIGIRQKKTSKGFDAGRSEGIPWLDWERMLKTDYLSFEEK